MAKLSAYGQHEVARFVRERMTPDSTLVEWERKTMAVMHNGRVLVKYDVRFRASTYTETRFHSYGWKVHGHLKKGRTVADAARQLLKQGYVAVPHKGRFGEQSAYALPVEVA